MLCSVSGCDRPPLARGFCPPHYGRWRRHRDPLAGGPEIERLPGVTACVVIGCDRPRYQRRRFCSIHAMRMHRYGDLETHSRAGRVHTDSNGYVVEGTTDARLRWPSGSATRQHRRVLLAKLGPGDQPCAWCGRTLRWTGQWPRDPDAVTVDHLDEDHANNDPNNLVPACGRCNMRRFVSGRRRDKAQRWLPRGKNAPQQL